MKWRVRVATKYVHEVEVEAKDWGDARMVASQMLPPTDEPHYIDTDVLLQLGEPWVSGGWVRLHSVKDVAVFDRAHGHKFTGQDVAILKIRLESLGLTVTDSWNGKGTNTVSFRCKGRQGVRQFTSEQLAMICCPRSDDDGCEDAEIIAGEMAAAMERDS